MVKGCLDDKKTFRISVKKPQAFGGKILCVKISYTCKKMKDTIKIFMNCYCFHFQVGMGLSAREGSNFISKGDLIPFTPLLPIQGINVNKVF